MKDLIVAEIAVALIVTLGITVGGLMLPSLVEGEM